MFFWAQTIASAVQGGVTTPEVGEPSEAAITFQGKTWFDFHRFLWPNPERSASNDPPDVVTVSGGVAKLRLFSQAI